MAQIPLPDKDSLEVLMKLGLDYVGMNVNMGLDDHYYFVVELGLVVVV